MDYYLDTQDFGFVSVTKEEFEHIQSQFSPLWEDENTGKKYFFRVETAMETVTGSRILYSEPKKKEIILSDFEKALISLAEKGDAAAILKAVQKLAQQN